MTIAYTPRSATPVLLSSDDLIISFPAPKVVQMRLNRPKNLNAMTDSMEKDMETILDWFEQENSLWVMVVTGTGRIFCAGQDLKNWLHTRGTALSPSAKILVNPHGFGSLARRISRKTIICAMNGPAYGGGAEMIFGCDMVFAAEGKCEVVFPEVLRGVTAGVGGIPNAVMRSPQFAPYLLTGLPIPLPLLRTHLFTQLLSHTSQVLPTALKWANQIVKASPDAVMVTKSQINLWKEGKGVVDVVKFSMEEEETKAMYEGENMGEGLKAFNEKRQPVWKDPKYVKAVAKL